jgi:hypothetical protein
MARRGVECVSPVGGQVERFFRSVIAKLDIMSIFGKSSGNFGVA